MKIGIIAAMDAEHEQIVRLLHDKTTSSVDGTNYVEGSVGSHQIVLARCGIGKVNAAVGTTRLLAHHRPEAVLSTGCAGGIDADLKVMDVVAATATVYHDVWCGQGNAVGQIQGMPLAFPSDERLLAAARALDAEKQTDTRVHCGMICTGDKFITGFDELLAIKRAFPQGLAVDMESAAIAHVAYLHGVPFLSFRVVSDTPGIEAHHEQYQDFWTRLAHSSFGVTRRFLESL